MRSWGWTLTKSGLSAFRSAIVQYYRPQKWTLATYASHHFQCIIASCTVENAEWPCAKNALNILLGSLSMATKAGWELARTALRIYTKIKLLWMKATNNRKQKTNLTKARRIRWRKRGRSRSREDSSEWIHWPSKTLKNTMQNFYITNRKQAYQTTKASLRLSNNSFRVFYRDHYTARPSLIPL